MQFIQRDVNLGYFNAYAIDRFGDNGKESVNCAKNSGRLVLPPQVLNRIQSLTIQQNVMIFKIINIKTNHYVFCGVHDFDGEPHKVLVPDWALKQLQIETGEEVSVKYYRKPMSKGVSVEFEPLTKEFLDITNPKFVLEKCIGRYVCITKGDVISIYYNRRVYELRICETGPEDTILITDCELEVEFKEMEQQLELPEESDLDHIQKEVTDNSFEAFSGKGRTVDGKNVTVKSNDNSNTSGLKHKLGVPDYGYKIGIIIFKRHKSDLTSSQTIKDIKTQKESKQSSDSKNKSVVHKPMDVIESPIGRPVTRSQTLRSRSGTTNAKTQTTEPIESPNDRKNNSNKTLKKQN